MAHVGVSFVPTRLAHDLVGAHQLPDPTTVTLCFCSWAPRVAIALADAVGSCLDVEEVRREEETPARRRRAVAVVEAILAVEGS